MCVCVCVCGAVQSQSCYQILTAEPSDCSSGPVCVIYKYSITLRLASFSPDLLYFKPGTLFPFVLIKQDLFCVCSGVANPAPSPKYHPSIDLHDDTGAIWFLNGLAQSLIQLETFSFTPSGARVWCTDCGVDLQLLQPVAFSLNMFNSDDKNCWGDCQKLFLCGHETAQGSN